MTSCESWSNKCSNEGAGEENHSARASKIECATVTRVLQKFSEEGSRAPDIQSGDLFRQVLRGWSWDMELISEFRHFNNL